jgi:hypothetical protein
MQVWGAWPPATLEAFRGLPERPPRATYSFVDALPGVRLDQPVATTTPPGETQRLFIVEKTGRIVVITNLSQPTRTVFATLTNNLLTSGEQGLLGLAFHPRYSENRRLFVFRTLNTGPGTTRQAHNVLTEFRTSADNPNALGSIPYTSTGYHRWLDTNGYPALKPPWGTLTAIDLNTGRHRWQVPLGEYPELTARGLPPTGTENYGGPIVTAGGLVFIAASRDEHFRAFDRKTGRELWKAQLPAAGYATPATYSVNGRQFVVIACGGGKIGTRSSDAYVAFALP